MWRSFTYATRSSNSARQPSPDCLQSPRAVAREQPGMTQCRGVEVAFVPHMVNHREMIGEGGSGGAHCDYETAATNLGAVLRQNLERGMNTPVEELLKKRY